MSAPFGLKENVTFLAPMQDITDRGFIEVLCARGAPDFCIAEYFRIHEYFELSPHILDAILNSPAGTRVAAQFIGENTGYISQAIEALKRYCKINMLDLNLGCPAPKIYRKNVGGGLLRDIGKIAEIVRLIRSQWSGIFSVKMRIGFDSTDNFDELFDAEIITNINTVDNSLNEASMTISDAQGTNFFAGYYKGEYAFVDTTGFCEWLDGAIDLDAFNLPKVYFDNIDLTKIINAGYNNLVKAMLVLLEGMSGDIDTPENEELFNIILENFGNDGESVIWYRITEELIQKIRGDEESVMSIVAEALGVDQSRLESYLGEDFFSSSEVIISYNLDTGVITVTMNQRGEMLFEMTLIRDQFNGITFPVDANPESSAYSKLNIPDVTTLEFDVSFNVRNGKTQTDLSALLGVFVGDTTGVNTARALLNTETLIIRGTVTEKYIGNAEGQTVAANTVDVSVYLRSNSGQEVLMMTVCTNPSDVNELLIDYKFPLGDRAEGTAFKYRIDKNVIKEGFNALLGEDSIFDENSLLTILDKVINSDGVSAVSKNDGWFYFSLVVSDESDPVYELIGLENTTATVKARILFTGIEKDIDVNEYFRPVITKPDDVTVESMYTPGSAWKQSAEVVIGSEIVHMKPTYSAESIEIVTGKTVYSPSAFLFGTEYGYNLNIYSEVGTYKVERLDLPDNSLFIDPAFTNTLPTKIPVFFDNGQSGELDCIIEGFSSDNVTLPHYRREGQHYDHGERNLHFRPQS